MTFTAVTKASIGFSDASAGVQQTLVNRAGKTVGFDESYGPWWCTMSGAGRIIRWSTAAAVVGVAVVAAVASPPSWRSGRGNSVPL